MNSNVIRCQYPVWWNAVSSKQPATTKSTQWTDNRIKSTFHTVSFIWQVHFSNYHAHTKFQNTSSVNLPLTNEVSINTTFHKDEISSLLRNTIYAFAVLWCRTAKVGSWLATCRFNMSTPCSEISKSSRHSVTVEYVNAHSMVRVMTGSQGPVLW